MDASTSSSSRAEHAAALDAAIQKLHGVRSCVLSVPQLLGDVSNDRAQQGLAAALQDMAASLGSLDAGWGRVSAAASAAHARAAATPGPDGAPAAAGSSGHSPPRAADPSAVDLFEAALTAAMVGANAACVAALCANSGVAQPDWARGESAATVHSRAAHGHGGGGGGGSSKGAGDGGIPSELARVIKSVTAAVPGATIVLCSVTGGMNVPAKEAVEVKLIFHQVLCASIALAAPGQPAPLNLQLDSYEHAATNDAWGGSGSHQVFRRVSSLAMRALSYFDKRAGVWASSGDGDASSVASGSPGSSAAPAPALSHGGMVLEDLLLWLCLYRGLFSVPCYVTGTLLAWDPSTGFSLPPIYRNFKCSRAQLRAAASSKDVSSIEAYHMHAVPVDMLDWCTNPDALVE